MELEKSFLLSSSRSKLIQVSIHMLTHSESLGFELMGLPRGIQMFRSGGKEKEGSCFPWEHSPRKEELAGQAAGCLPCIPIGRRLHRISMFQPRNSWWRRNFQERSHTELPVTQTSGAGRASSPGIVPRLRLPLALPQASVKRHYLHKVYVFPSPLPPPAPRASCSHHALTPGACARPPTARQKPATGVQYLVQKHRMRFQGARGTGVTLFFWFLGCSEHFLI